MKNDWTFAVVFSALMLTGPARAQSSPEQRAAGDALFQEGRELMAAGRLLEACPKLEGADRIRPGIGTKLNLALCYEKSGRSASAWSTFRAAQAAARAAHDSREQLAAESADRLEAVLVRLVVEVRAPVTELRIVRNGTPLDHAMWGSAVPIDPGITVIEASAPGRKTATVTREIRSGTVTIEIDPLVELGSKNTDPLPAANLPAPAAQPSNSRVPVIVAASVGVVGLGVGSVFGLLSKSSRDDASEFCSRGPNQDLCDQHGVDLRSKAIQRGNIATLSFIVGAVGIGSALVLWSYHPTDPTSPKARLGISPKIGTSTGTVMLEGTW